MKGMRKAAHSSGWAGDLREKPPRTMQANMPTWLGSPTGCPEARCRRIKNNYP